MDGESKKTTYIAAGLLLGAIIVGLIVRQVIVKDSYDNFCQDARRVEQALASSEPGSSESLDELFIQANESAPKSLRDSTAVFVKQRTEGGVTAEEAEQARLEWSEFVEKHCGVVRSQLNTGS